MTKKNKRHDVSLSAFFSFSDTGCALIHCKSAALAETINENLSWESSDSAETCGSYGSAFTHVATVVLAAELEETPAVQVRNILTGRYSYRNAKRFRAFLNESGSRIAIAKHRRATTRGPTCISLCIFAPGTWPFIIVASHSAIKKKNF